MTFYFLLYTSINTIQISLYWCFVNLYIYMWRWKERKTWELVIFRTKGGFSLYDTCLDALSVELWIQTKRFQPSEGCPTALNSSHGHHRTSHLTRKCILSYTISPATEDMSWFKVFRNLCLVFLTNCELFEGLTGFSSFLYALTVFPKSCSTDIYTSLTDAII